MAAARMSPRAGAMALALACLSASGSASALEKTEEAAVLERLGLADEAVGMKMDAEMDTLVTRFLEPSGRDFPNHKEMADVAERKVSPKVAAQMLRGKLPADVQSMVQVGDEGDSQQPFSEDSLAKARRYLNEMMFKAWAELDDKVIACKEFEDKSRGSQEQVKTDIARLAEQIAELERVKATATESIQTKDQEIRSVMATLRKERADYMKIYLPNRREMTIRRADMAVFQFMMTLTKCKSAAAFAQLHGSPRSGTRICQTQQGLTLDFGDKKAEERLERMMTPSARKAVQELLENMEADRATEEAELLQKGRPDETALLQVSGGADVDGGDDNGDAQGSSDGTAAAVLEQEGAQSEQGGAQDEQEDDSATTTATTTQGAPTPPVKKSRVAKRLDVRIGGRKCPNRVPDCGLIHDKMSLMWGKFKDLVDELQATMDKNAFEYKNLVVGLNAQIDIMRTSKTRFIMELNEATAGLNADREELAEKQEELRVYMKKYYQFMRQCSKRIKWIFFQDFCAYFVVRKQVMVHSTVSPPGKIVDCALTAFIPGDCSVECDDTCGKNPHNPYVCGGKQTLTRGIMVAPNEFGIKCGIRSRDRRCNQVKCPVDCVMSRWSRFGKCSKDCEGGVQGRTRNIVTKPKNGGKKCNTVQESRACNTGSCDRNCRLKYWTSWSPCSVACGRGFQERWRRVLIPIRGEGKCPKPKSSSRYGIRNCNTHKCNGDEICVAKQDLVIAIDGSGSLTEPRFKILKAFVAGYIDKYKGKYYGLEDMKIGVVQFGNGAIKDDGSITEALLIQELTHDMAAVKTKVEGLTYTKGFTNMAQSFTVAEKVLNLGGRTKAMSAVLTITDGKPSFIFQTNEMVMQLKDKAVKLFFAPVTAYKGTELKLMKKWASKPWATNLVRIPGFAPMQADMPLFQQRMLVKFCPQSVSPGAKAQQEKERCFMLVRESGRCGTRGAYLGRLRTPRQCSDRVQKAGLKAFSFGTHYARGRCYGEGLAVTTAMVTTFQSNRADPACPGGSWVPDSLYDFYVRSCGI